MRIELSDENSKKATDATKQLFDEYGIQVSPNQIINILVGAVKTVELEQIVTLTLHTPGTSPGEESRQKVIRARTNWIFDWKK